MLTNVIKGYLLYHNINPADEQDEEKKVAEQDFTEVGLDVLLVTRFITSIRGMLLKCHLEHTPRIIGQYIF